MTHVASINNVPVVHERPTGWVKISQPQLTTVKALLVTCEGTQIWVPKRNCRIYAGAYYASRPAIQAARNWAAKNPRNR
jgi:hypothetical protein